MGTLRLGTTLGSLITPASLGSLSATAGLNLASWPLGLATRLDGDRANRRGPQAQPLHATAWPPPALHVRFPRVDCTRRITRSLDPPSRGPGQKVAVIDEHSQPAGGCIGETSPRVLGRLGFQFWALLAGGSEPAG